MRRAGAHDIVSARREGARHRRPVWTRVHGRRRAHRVPGAPHSPRAVSAQACGAPRVRPAVGVLPGAAPDRRRLRRSAARSQDASAICRRCSRRSGERCGGIGSTMRASALKGSVPRTLAAPGRLHGRGVGRVPTGGAATSLAAPQDGPRSGTGDEGARADAHGHLVRGRRRVRRSALQHGLEVAQRQLVRATVRRAALRPGDDRRVRNLVRGAGGRGPSVALGDLGESGGQGVRAAAAVVDDVVTGAPPPVSRRPPGSPCSTARSRSAR